jgi:hypothetical protein
LDPQYGANLMIDNKKVSDRAIVHKNGTKAVAYVWSDAPFEDCVDGQTGAIVQIPRAPGNEVVAELIQVSEEQGGKLVGIDKVTGEPSTWVISDSPKRCRGCAA